ncbi:YceI family protein [Streptomyces xiangluensis]|uniref:YceI family protein n=1 Tax=Streptomyces xiangluensis TaxID=2665720 RepID=A0ABV8YHJ1_9ACTN
MHGWLQVDPDEPEKARVEATIDATQVYTGQPERDRHPRDSDFFDAEHQSTWTFVGSPVHQLRASEFEVPGSLTVRGVMHPVPFDVTHLGPRLWETGMHQALAGGGASSAATSTAISTARPASGEWIRPARQCR